MSLTHIFLSHMCREELRCREEARGAKMESIPRKCWRDYIYSIWPRNALQSHRRRYDDEDVAGGKYVWATLLTVGPKSTA